PFAFKSAPGSRCNRCRSLFAELLAKSAFHLLEENQYWATSALQLSPFLMAMLRVPVIMLFLATAWAQELSQQELDPALAADDECADGGDTCVVELLQARASKDVRAEHASSAEKNIEGAYEQLLQQNATANATANASQPPCRGINEACWIDLDCCSARCGLTRRCRPVR
ncbi:unnamed protein product, partial [Prorocentrum cordatum]